MRMQSIGSTTEFTEQMFTIGWIVECCTMHNEVLTGEVVSFDYETKLLVLKSAASNGTGNASNIICINLDWCSDIKIIKEASPSGVVVGSSGGGGDSNNGGQTAVGNTAVVAAATPTNNNSNSNNVLNHNHHSSNSADNTKLPVIDIDKVEKRANNAINERRQLINAFKSGAGTEGVLLYISLIKTLGESVSFDSDSIIIKKTVRISPPYRPNSVAAIRSNTVPEDSVSFVKQLVEKYWQNKDSLTGNGSSDGVVGVGAGAAPAAGGDSGGGGGGGTGPTSKGPNQPGAPPHAESPTPKRNTTAASIVAASLRQPPQQQQPSAGSAGGGGGGAPSSSSTPINNSNYTPTSSTNHSSVVVNNSSNSNTSTANPNPSNYSKVVASSNTPQRDHHHHHPPHSHHPQSAPAQQQLAQQASDSNPKKRSPNQQHHHQQQHSQHQRNADGSHSKK